MRGDRHSEAPILDSCATCAGSGGNCSHQCLDADDVENAGEIVCENMQRHFGADILQSLHLEMGRAHPSLDGSEGMLNG